MPWLLQLVLLVQPYASQKSSLLEAKPLTVMEDTEQTEKTLVQVETLANAILEKAHVFNGEAPKEGRVAIRQAKSTAAARQAPDAVP